MAYAHFEYGCAEQRPRLRTHVLMLFLVVGIVALEAVTLVYLASRLNIAGRLGPVPVTLASDRR